jgi:hydrogenase expression/formation protein HypE
VVPAASAEAAAAAMRRSPYGAMAAVAGRVLEGPPGRVVLNTGIGSRRVVDWISGEPLPRIC